MLSLGAAGSSNILGSSAGLGGSGGCAKPEEQDLTGLVCGLVFLVFVLIAVAVAVGLTYTDQYAFMPEDVQRVLDPIKDNLNEWRPDLQTNRVMLTAIASLYVKGR